MEQPSTPAQVVLLIPALNPDGQLLELLEAVKDVWVGPILLVDDGSGPDCRDLFVQAEALGCDVIRHARNLGKGRGLKTGFNYCLTHYPDIIGCVTADADGQHTPADIAACADALRAAPTALVLGCRDFSQDNVPAKSMLGNRITRTVMRFLCGVGVTDTQTGLRAISADFMACLLDVPGERFEFETNMLLETRTQEVPIREVTIQTVYLEGNKSSHFNPLLDSVRIYALLLRFCAASLIGFVVDILCFYAFLRLLRPLASPDALVASATLLARVVSATANYLINRKAVFKSKKRAARSGPRYAALCVVQVLLSAGLVTVLDRLFPGVTVVLKIVVDLCLFLLSFQVQRRWVF